MEGQDRGVPTLFIIPLMLFFVGCLLFIALLYGQRDLTILCLLVLGMAGGAKWWTRVSLSAITCHSQVDKQKLFPGEKLTLRASAENAKFLPVWLRINIPVGGPLKPVSGDGGLTREGGLLWYQRADFQWELLAQRRGVYQLGPLQLMAGDLFAFFSSEKKAETSHPILVYPRLVLLKPFPFPKRDFFGVPGAKSPVQDPIYILGTRDYQHGQPSKHIHWKASARHNRLQEKIFEPTEQEKVLLAVDVTQFEKAELAEEFERTLEIVASLAVRLDRRGYALGLATNGTLVGRESGMVPITRNYKQLPAILEVLARLQMKSRGNLIDLFRRELELPWGISCVYFSYEEDGTLAAAEEYFLYRKTPVKFLICQPRLDSEEYGSGVRQKIYSLDEITFRKVLRE